MKTKQKNIRIFEIEADDYDEAVAYLEKNAELFRPFILALRGLSAQKLLIWATYHEYCAFIAPECMGSPRKAAPKQKTTLFNEERAAQIFQEPQKPIESEKVQNEPQNGANNRMLINRVLRSGEIIQSEGDVVVFGRINSGAKIITKGAVEVFDEIDGLVECEGDYIILRSIGKGSVIFCNETIKKEILKYDLQRLFFENGALQVRKI